MNRVRALPVFVLCAVFGAPGPAAAVTRTSPVEVGRHAPFLSFTDRGGTVHNIDWEGGERANVFFFFDPRSQGSFRGLSLLESFHQEVADYGVRIFAIEASGLDEAGYATAMERYQRVYGDPSYTVVLDPEFALSAVFGIQGVPSSYLLERHGVTLYRTTDFEDAAAVGLAIRLERILARDEGFLSPSLQEVGIDENVEKALRAEATSGRSRRAGPAGLLKVGDRVEPFAYTDLEGVEHRLSPGGGKGLSIVFFWGALCLPCIQEMGFLTTIHERAGGFNLEILAVEATGLSAERTAGVIKRYERFQKRPAYAVVPDPDKRISGHFGVSGKIPQTFFISAEGKVIYHTDEFIDEGAGGLARKIERAIGAEAGTLSRASGETGSSGPSPSLFETPSGRSDAEADFRSNLVQGDSYYNAWEFDKALPHYLACLELQPNHVYLRKRVAEIHERRGEFEEAIAQWQRVLAAEPEDADAGGRISNLREMQKRGTDQP
jgi:peroxiredoxin